MAVSTDKQQVKILEKGEVYFIYTPKVEEETVRNFSEVERFYMVLHPFDQQVYRLVVVGQKKLPPVSHHGESYWAFVDKVCSDPEEIEDEFDPESYRTKTRGIRFRGPGRPAGEGVYALVEHGNHIHFIYSLQLPKTPGSVQKALNIENEGSYIISIKNPDQPTPPRIGLEESQEAKYSPKLQSLFGLRKFISKDVPQYLNYSGTQILLISAAKDYSEELGIDLNPEQETIENAKIFTDLKMEKQVHPIKTLISGQWE